jgi:hypothetical protein
MQLELVPLLQIQRQLHSIPRGMERFREYLRVMLTDDRSDVRLPPLGIVNPMGKEHVTALLDAFLRLDAEGEAAHALLQAAANLAELGGAYKVGLVVADDLRGGWTNRYASEFSFMLGGRAGLKRGWLTGILWSSEPASAGVASRAILTAIYRAVYVQERGSAHTLREILAQEGYAMAAARCADPTLDADDMAYTREVMAPLLKAEDQPTLIACLFGDTAARSLGYPPQGLSERAGLAMALRDAQSDPPWRVPAERTVAGWSADLSTLVGHEPD